MVDGVIVVLENESVGVIPLPFYPDDGDCGTGK
jgi:hypothetical protein